MDYAWLQFTCRMRVSVRESELGMASYQLVIITDTAEIPD